MRKYWKKIAAGILAVAVLTFIGPRFVAPAVAQSFIWVSGGSLRPSGSTSLETVACNAGVSPCTVGAVSTTILNANPVRAQCLIVNGGTTDFYCIHGSGTASLTNMHFILNANAANKSGGTYTCNQGPYIWKGIITCVSSAGGGTLLVSAGNSG